MSSLGSTPQPKLTIIVGMSSRSIFPTSPNRNFCDLCAHMNDLPRLYEEQLSKCIRKEFDQIIKRLKQLQQLDEQSVSYWEHRQNLSINLKRYLSPLYSLEKFGELVDFGAISTFSNEKTSNSVCASQKINVKGFREGQILTWSVEAFDILQAIGLLLPSVPNTYKSFLYPLKPNPKQLEEFLEGCISQFLSYLRLKLPIAKRCLLWS